jgi:ABC-type multidrug transport system fused ATPase/permease subunit
MAIVQQEPVLFSGSIRENIVYGLKKEPTDDEIDEACR